MTTPNAICGQGGAVLVGTHEVAEIGAWDMTLSRTPIPVPKFGISREKILCGPYEWAGTFTGNWYMDDAAGQAALEDALVGGTTVALFLQTAGTTDYNGTAYITSVAVSTPHDGIVSVTFNFEGTGDLTRAHAGI